MKKSIQENSQESRKEWILLGVGILLLLFFSIGSNGYSQDLASLRDKYCVHPLCKAYKRGRFKKSIDYETIKIFSIPFAERKKIFPFSEYDSSRIIFWATIDLTY